MTKLERKNYIKGLIYTGVAFVLWGLLPLYWKLVDGITPYQIFAHRVSWSVLFIVLILLYKKKLQAFGQALKVGKNWLYVIPPTVFISINWLTYIWSVNSGYVIEASLGYYINPLVLTLLGVIFLKERLTRIQWIGMAFAGIGVLLKTLMYGRIPVVAFVLAVSFAIYGLLKKQSKFDGLTGLGFETIIVGIPSVFYLLFVEASGTGISGNLPPTFWFLICISGVVTAIPLLLYAEGTKRLPLTVVGFMQYIAPTISLVLGIFVFKEAFELSDIIPFALIWIGLICFTYSQVRILKKVA